MLQQVYIQKNDGDRFGTPYHHLGRTTDDSAEFREMNQDDEVCGKSHCWLLAEEGEVSLRSKHGSTKR